MDEVRRDIEDTMNEPAFHSYCEFTQTKDPARYQLPRDMPALLYEWMKHKSSKMKEQLEGSKEYVMSTQKDTVHHACLARASPSSAQPPRPSPSPTLTRARRPHDAAERDHAKPLARRPRAAHAGKSRAADELVRHPLPPTPPPLLSSPPVNR